MAVSIKTRAYVATAVLIDISKSSLKRRILTRAQDKAVWGNKSLEDKNPGLLK